MVRRSKLCTKLSATMLCLAGMAMAQESPAKPAPGISDGVLGLQLIAWSELQKPQPVPQKPEPLPPPDTTAEPSQQQNPAQSQPSQGSQQTQPVPETQQSTIQSITGTVVKIGNKYVLETEDNIAYQLDDQDRAKQFEGKHVKVLGTLDRSTGIIHIKSIELLS